MELSQFLPREVKIEMISLEREREREQNTCKHYSRALTTILISAFLMLAVTAVMPITPVRAVSTWYVDPSGTNDGSHGTGPGANAFKTIQYAINDGRVSSGDTIQVAAGLYQEDITISKSLTLQGAGRTTTTILRNTATDSVVLIQANNVKITGFKIDGGSGPPYPCTSLVGVAYGAVLYENVEVSNCHLTGASRRAVRMWPGAPNIGHGYKVNDNIIEHFGGTPGLMGTGMTFGNALDVEAKGNTIRNSEPYSSIGAQYGGYAIYFMDYTGGTVEDNTISDCYYGIVLNSVVEETWVRSNTITECHRGILTGEIFAKLHITDNSITTRRDPFNPAAAKFKDEQGILIGGDGDFYDSSPPYPYQVDNLQHEVSGNTVTGTKTTDSIGIGVMPGWWDKDYGASGTFTGNDVSGYSTGLKVYGTYAAYAGSTEDMTSHVHVSFAFNNIVDCTTDAAVDTVWSGAAGGIDAENNWWGADTGPDTISDRYDYDPWLCVDVEGGLSETVSGDGTVDATDEADISVVIDAVGDHTVTCVEYANNPDSAFSNEIGKYYDVSLDDDTNVNSLTIRFYYTDADIAGRVESSLKMYWWDKTTSTWELCSDQTLHTEAVDGYSGYIEVTIDTTTEPDLDYLANDPPFGPAGNPKPVGGEVFTIDKLILLAPYVAAMLVIATGAVLIKRHRY